MNRDLLCVFVLTALLLVAGCSQSEPPEVEVAEPVVAPPTSTTLTLSAEQLMSLDWDGRRLGRPAVIDQRAVEGGVEFDIHFPSNLRAARSIDYTSSGSGGRGALVGLNVGSYETFALKITLLSVTGLSKPDLPQEVVVGALIGPAGDGRLSVYEPLSLGFASGRTTGVATTAMATQRIRLIGIHAHMANPEVWDAEGSVLRLRVEPVAADAGTLAPPPPTEERKPRRQKAKTSDYAPTFGPGSTKAW